MFKTFNSEMGRDDLNRLPSINSGPEPAEGNGWNGLNALDPSDQIPQILNFSLQCALAFGFAAVGVNLAQRPARGFTRKPDEPQGLTELVCRLSANKPPGASHVSTGLLVYASVLS
jgi:hypothetical protein